MGFFIAKNIIPLEIIEKIKNDFNDLLKSYLKKHINIDMDKNTYYYLNKLYEYDEKVYGEIIKQNGILARLKETNLLQFNESVLDMLRELGIY